MMKLLASIIDELKNITQDDGIGSYVIEKYRRKNVYI